MNYATAIIALAFFAYTFISRSILGPIDSISESYYRWKLRKYGAAFNIFGFVVFLGCVLQTQYPYKDLTHLFFVLSGSCCWFLTVASEYKRYKMHHYIPTIATIVFGFLAVWAEYGFGFNLYSSFGVFAAGTLLLSVFKIPARIVWIELLAMSCILFYFL